MYQNEPGSTLRFTKPIPAHEKLRQDFMKQLGLLVRHLIDIVNISYCLPIIHHSILRCYIRILFLMTKLLYLIKRIQRQILLSQIQLRLHLKQNLTKKSLKSQNLTQLLINTPSLDRDITEQSFMATTKGIHIV